MLGAPRRLIARVIDTGNGITGGQGSGGGVQGIDGHRFLRTALPALMMDDVTIFKVEHDNAIGQGQRLQEVGGADTKRGQRENQQRKGFPGSIHNRAPLNPRRGRGGRRPCDTRQNGAGHHHPPHALICHRCSSTIKLRVSSDLRRGEEAGASSGSLRFRRTRPCPAPAYPHP